MRSAHSLRPDALHLAEPASNAPDASTGPGVPAGMDAAGAIPPGARPQTDVAGPLPTPRSGPVVAAAWPVPTLALTPALQTAVRRGVALVLLTVLGLGAWAAWAPLDGAIIAPGVLKVPGLRKTVQHLEGGLVRQIHVRDGDVVRQGDVLVTLTDERAAASLDLLARQVELEQLRVARLAAQRDQLPALALPPDLQARAAEPAVADAVRRERALFTLQRDTLARQTALLQQQIGQAQDELAAVLRQQAADDRATALMQDELRAYESLSQQNFVAGAAVLRLQRSLQDYEARLAEHQADAARARQRGTELALTLASRHNEFRQSAGEQLVQAMARLGELQERHRAAQDQVARQRVLAPMDGTVVALRLGTPGGVVKPGDVLLDLVPVEGGVIVEAQINLDDVDHVRVGQPAQVRLTAFNARSAPLLDGRVVYVSADKLDSERGDRSFYLVRVALPPAAGDAASWQAGMRAEVFLRTAPRTALQYLMEPISESLRRAAREP